MHLLYLLLLKLLSNKSIRTSLIERDTRPKRKRAGVPFVSVIVPVYNEELVIERRLNNIFETTYPREKIEVIVVDSGSDDKTSTIINDKFRGHVTFIREDERSGKAHAINLALDKCRGDIVILTDGPTLYQKETISEIVSSFEDSSIGGVSVLYKIPNNKDNQITASESIIWSYKNRIRVLESKVFSTSWLSGEACAFRREIVEYVSEDTLADDSNIAFQVISKGYRAVINENSNFVEKSPSEADDYFKTKTRRALGGIKEILRFKFLLLNPHYGCFGLIIFPYRFFAEVISPIPSLIAAGLIIPALTEVGIHLGLNIIIPITVALVLSVFFLRCTIIAYIYTQLILLKALILLLKGKSDVRWIQARTTRRT
jgi:cellulose synthase/poly-beta-1,6-N-acetylglucosamine synthase-like glycosyltransferase